MSTGPRPPSGRYLWLTHDPPASWKSPAAATATAPPSPAPTATAASTVWPGPPPMRQHPGLHTRHRGRLRRLGQRRGLRLHRRRPDGRDVASCWDFYADPDEPITADAPRPGPPWSPRREEIDHDVEARTAQANTIGSGFIGLI